jgi:hypothetical protein
LNLFLWKRFTEHSTPTFTGPYDKQPTSEPITTKETPAVRANAGQAAHSAAEAARYSSQAALDALREANAHVVEPVNFYFLFFFLW